MRDPERIDEICQSLAEIWKMVPDWRFTQILSNLNIVGDRTDSLNFFQEDDVTLLKLEAGYRYLKELE